MRLIVCLVIALCAGCASQPQPTHPATTRVASAATPTPAPAGAQESGNFKPPDGYRTRKKGDVTVYCKSEAILGSHFPQEFCFTADELKEVARRSEDMRLNKQKMSGICGGVAQACGNQ